MLVASALIVALFTSAGEIDINVDQTHAPKTAANFISNVKRGAYTNGAFFRTVTTHPDNQPNKTRSVKIDVIQARNAPSFRIGSPVAFEPTSVTGLKHRDGTVSMARTDVQRSATTNFFICIGAQPSLDDGGRRSADHRGFAAFGQVVHGMDVVRAIQRSPQKNSQLLIQPVIIRRATIRETPSVRS
jgi:peptidyl-prolyl cis-trans isomerase A (cyclophilin A)